MMSDIIASLADRLAGYALQGRGLEAEHCGIIAQGLADVAKQVRALESQPFIANPQPRATPVFHARRRNG